MSTPQTPELPAELAELQGIAAAADAELQGQALPPGAAEPPPEVDEAKSVAGALCLVAMVGSKFCPPIGETYGTAECEAIAAEYLRCAEQYGWTFHKAASNPVLGLCAAVALPAVLNAEKFAAWAAERKRAQLAAQQPQRQPAQVPVPLQPVTDTDPRPHAGQRIT